MLHKYQCYSRRGPFTYTTCPSKRAVRRTQISAEKVTAPSEDARVLYNTVTLARNYQLVPQTHGSTHGFAKICLTWIKKQIHFLSSYGATGLNVFKIYIMLSLFPIKFQLRGKLCLALKAHCDQWAGKCAEVFIVHRSILPWHTYM